MPEENEPLLRAPETQRTPWRALPGINDVEMRVEHDIRMAATVIEARTRRNGQELRARGMITDELLANASQDDLANGLTPMQVANADAQYFQETQVHTVSDLLHFADETAPLPGARTIFAPPQVVAALAPQATPAGPVQYTPVYGTPIVPTGYWQAPGTTITSFNVYASALVPAATAALYTMNELRTAVGVWNNNTTNLRFDWGNMYYTTTTVGSGTGLYTFKPMRPLTVMEEAVRCGQDIMRRAPAMALKQMADHLSELMLQDLIGTEKYEYWRKNGCIHVTSKKFRGKVRYQIKAGEMIQIEELRNGTWKKRDAKLCIHPLEQFPRGDEAAALYALATFDEDTLWKVANKHGSEFRDLVAA